MFIAFVSFAAVIVEKDERRYSEEVVECKVVKREKRCCKCR